MNQFVTTRKACQYTFNVCSKKTNKSCCPIFYRFVFPELRPPGIHLDKGNECCNDDVMAWHYDVIKWKHFPRYCPFVWGIVVIRDALTVIWRRRNGQTLCITGSPLVMGAFPPLIPSNTYCVGAIIVSMEKVWNRQSSGRWIRGFETHKTST